MRKVILSAVLFVTFCLSQELVAQADPVVITPTTITLTGTAGSVLTLSWTFTNPGAQPFTVTALTGSLFSSPIVSTFSPGSGAFPTVAPGVTTSPAPIIIFTLAPNAAAGNYEVFITAGGRSNFPNGPFETSNPASFTIRVIPEPATVALLGTGLLGVGVYRRRKARGER